MLENLNDVLSLLVICSIPFGILFLTIHLVLGKRKRKNRNESGKFYPEW